MGMFGLMPFGVPPGPKLIMWPPLLELEGVGPCDGDFEACLVGVESLGLASISILVPEPPAQRLGIDEGAGHKGVVGQTCASVVEYPLGW